MNPMARSKSPPNLPEGRNCKKGGGGLGGWPVDGCFCSGFLLFVLRRGVLRSFVACIEVVIWVHCHFVHCWAGG